MGSSKQTTPVSSSSSGPAQFAIPALSQGFDAVSRSYSPTTQSPIYAAGSGLLQQVLGGKFLDPSTNPYLTSTFNQGADAIQQRLASEFAGSGRDVTSRFARENLDLNSLASSIYGGAYQQERGLMNQALGLVPALSADPAMNQYIQNLATLGGVSQQSTGSSQQTYYGGGLAGAAKGGLGGALTGAKIGTMFGGPYGTAIGAGIGGLVGLIGGM